MLGQTTVRVLMEFYHQMKTENMVLLSGYGFVYGLGASRMFVYDKWGLVVHKWVCECPIVRKEAISHICRVLPNFRPGAQEVKCHSLNLLRIYSWVWLAGSSVVDGPVRT